MKYRAVVMGTSSGGFNALKAILPVLPGNFPLPVIVLQHLGPSSENYWIEILNNGCTLQIKEADEKEKIVAGTVYVAPANYHLMVEADETLSLSIDPKVNYARPSIDVLFESAAAVYKEGLIGVILTGANHDGAKGLETIKRYGGLTVVQEPDTAESKYMPSAAIGLCKPDFVVPLSDIAGLLKKIVQL